MWVSDRLRGHSTITADDVHRIMAALGMDPCVFFHADEAPTPGYSLGAPDLEALYMRAVPFAREIVEAWPGLQPEEQRLIEAMARAVATAAASAAMVVLRQGQADSERK